MSIRVLLVLNILISTGIIIAQNEYQVACNASTCIGYAPDEFLLKKSYKIVHISGGKRQIIVNYQPDLTVQSLKVGLASLPKVFREPPYINEENFLNNLMKEWGNSERLGDLTLWHMPWVQFALGIAFEIGNVQEGDYFEWRDASESLISVSYPTPAKEDFQDQSRPISIKHPGYASEQPLFTWAVFPFVEDQVLSFITLRKSADNHVWKEISTLGGLSVRNDTLYITVRDTTLNSAGIYTYAVQPYDKFGRSGGISQSVDYYHRSEYEQPRLIYFSADGLKDKPANQISWKIKHKETLNNIVIKRSRLLNGPYEVTAVLSSEDTSHIDLVTDIMEVYYYKLILQDRFNNQIDPGLIAPSISTYEQPVLAPVFDEIHQVDEGIQISWIGGGPSVRGYYVYRCIEPCKNSWHQVSEFLSYDGISQKMNWIDTSSSLQGDLWYRYGIKAESHAYLQSELSDSQVIRPDKPVPVAPVSGLTIKNHENGILLLWDDLGPIEPYLMGYQLGIIKKGENQINWDKSRIIPPEQNYLELSNDDQIKSLTVRAVNFFGHHGSYGLPVDQFFNMDPKTDGPEFLMGKVLPGRKISFRWNPVNNEEVKGYNLLQFSEEGTPAVFLQIEANQTEVEVEVNQTGVTYWAVSAFYLHGKESNISEILMLEIKD